MFRTRWIRKLLDRPNGLPYRRRQMAKARKTVRLLLEVLEDRVVPCDSTSVVASHAHVNFDDHGNSSSFVLPVSVKDLQGGYAHSGTVSCHLVANGKTIDLGSADVDDNGVANCQIKSGALPSDLKPGTYELEEDFEGDNDHYYSCSATTTLTIDQQITTIAPVNVTINESTSSTAPSFTVSVGVNCSSGPVNGGTVTLDVVSGKTTINLGTATVGANGVATLTVSDHETLQDLAELAPGSYQLTETYSGNDSFAGSNVTCNFTITSKSNATTLAVPNVTIDTTSGTVPSFAVAVAVNSSSGTVNAGTVALDLVTPNGTVNLGSAPVGSNGVATITVSDQAALEAISDLPPGSYELVETYSGSGPFVGGSATSTLTITSTTIPTTLAVPDVTVNINSSTSPSFTLAVAVNSPSAMVNGGTVTFNLVTPNGNINLGSATVGPNGVATLTVSDQDTLQDLASLPPGSYELVETYSGSGPFVGGSTTSTFTITNVPTTITAPSINVNLNLTSTPAPFIIDVNVTTPTGPVSTGTLTINLVNGTQTIPLGTGTPCDDGTFMVNVTGQSLSDLASLPPGTYQIVVNYSGGPGSPDSGSSTTGNLTIAPSSVLPDLGTTAPASGGGVSGSSAPAAPSSGLTPIQAALQLALEAAMLGNMNNPGSVGELEAFSSVFLGHAIPTSLPQLMSDITSLVPQAGPMLGPALGFASFLDFDLPIENPM